MNMKTDIDPGRALKRWRFLAIAWPLLCLVFAGIIVCQPGRGGEERFVDAAFTIFPLIFFAIGMTIQRRLLKEQRYATVLTTADVISIECRTETGSGNKRCYFPEYEFQIGEKIYHAKSKSGFGRSYVKKGDQVDLYYSPKDPNIFYVPIMQKHDRRWAVLLCGVGIVYPLIGLFAPAVRQLFSFL